QDSEVLLATTEVTFRVISAEDCLKYWQSGEPKGKAGGYAIQGLGAIFVERLEGSYSGVVGLPLMETETLLRRFNVSRWHG
ncbi:MAG: septum formation protein, partial [Porticoccaceae bacterium]